MAGLTQEQIEMLKGMPGIDQSLLANYKPTGTPGTAVLPEGETVAETYKRAQNVVAANPGNVSPSRVTQTEVGAPIDNSAVDSQKTISDFNNFQVALNTAIDEARQQRKDSVLDMMGGEIPAGSLPATSFANVLSAFNNSAAPIEASLLSSATSFARDQIEREEAAKEAAEQLKEDNKNSVNELYIALAQTGNLDPATLAAILPFAEEGDYQGALKAAGGFLGNSEEIQIIDGQVVKISKKDGEFSTDVLWTAPSSSSGGGGGGGGGGGIPAGGDFGWEDTDIEKLNNEDINWRTNLSYDRQSQIIHGIPETDKLGTEAALNQEVDPATGFTKWERYRTLRDIAWTDGISNAKFYQLFPPQKWLNPNDPLPAEVKNLIKKPDTSDTQTEAERNKELYGLTPPEGYQPDGTTY